MYQPDILFKGIKLWDKKSGINATYFLSILDKLDCNGWFTTGILQEEGAFPAAEYGKGD